MKKDIKFKFIPSSRIYESWEYEDYIKVENPLPYTSLPDGDYCIRGNHQGHKKKYWKANGNWYFIDEYTERRKGIIDYDYVEYMLFPSLPEKTWDMIRNVDIKILNKEWKKNLVAHDCWMNLRNTYRNAMLSIIKITDKKQRIYNL